MYRMAARLLGASAAADACQEALLHVRAGAHRFRPPADMDPDVAARAWLLRVAANAANAWARSEGRRHHRERLVAGDHAAAPVAEEDFAVVRQALSELPESLRLPVVLHHLEGQDFIAVAATLGTSPGAARVRAHRGMDRLRSQLARAGVLTAAVGLLDQLSAAEITIPSATSAGWTTLGTSSITPAVASTTAIFGGFSIMAKISLLCAGLAVASLITVSARSMSAEEHAAPPAVKPPTTKPVAADDANKPKEESHTLLAEGTKGTTEGVILSKDKEKGRVVLKTTDGNLLFAPYWHGGAPKDGGGLDKKVLAALDEFKVGDRVRIAWTWSERRRIEEITRIK